jgi:glycosyltransferase involved in cell wall biosynthesis
LETKGYVEFLEAISQLASNSQLPIAVVLCGKIVDKKEDEHRFTNPYEARQWIEKQITQINQSDYIRLRWVNGAVGEDKAKLFQEAHIFVLPSRYLVEAQPIVILEALASGCAVITTKIGEIPTTVNEETAFLLDECSPAAIAEAIRELSHNQKRRQELALNGLKLFQERFSYEKHIAQWESLLETFYS